jgi:hypothetical protein
MRAEKKNTEERLKERVKLSGSPSTTAGKMRIDSEEPSPHAKLAWTSYICSSRGDWRACRKSISGLTVKRESTQELKA